MKHRAFAQTCKACRKSRPLSDFKRPSSHKVNKTCVECLDARNAGLEIDVAPAGLAIYLPVVVTPEQRKVRRWWPSWVHAEDPSVRLNPRGANETRACAHCGAEYESKHRLQRYCSKRCKSAWNRPATREKRENLLDTQAKA